MCWRGSLMSRVCAFGSGRWKRARSGRSERRRSKALCREEQGERRRVVAKMEQCGRVSPRVVSVSFASLSSTATPNKKRKKKSRKQAETETLFGWTFLFCGFGFKTSAALVYL